MNFLITTNLQYILTTTIFIKGIELCNKLWYNSLKIKERLWTRLEVYLQEKAKKKNQHL